MSIKTIDMEDYKKKYEEALERAKDQLEKLKVVNVHGDVIEYIFPELAEPGDEKIRKELIDFFSASHATDTFRGISWDRVVSWLEKQCEQKPVEWDESIIDETISLINNLASGYGEKVDEPITFNGVKMINNIMERLRAIKPQPKQEWSEEDEKMLGKCIDAASGYYSPEDKQSMKDWLNSLKDRIQPQPKQEWSEEDRETIDYLIDYLESELDSSYTKEDKEEFTKEIELLKSLRPQNTWKPSDEQISVLSRSLKYINTISQNYCHVLGELLAQLKKLREE